MAKKIETYIKLQVPAGQANPSPPVGPALGQHGLNIMEFCKAFNAQTQNMEQGLPVPVVITVYADKSFTFVKKTTPASHLLKKAAGISSGSGAPNTNKVGTVTREQLEEIARSKEDYRRYGPQHGHRYQRGISHGQYIQARQSYTGRYRPEQVISCHGGTGIVKNPCYRQI